MSVPASHVGQVFGHYRLIEEIGAGGMGVVFRAHDEKLQRDVAVKILPQKLFDSEESRERFRNEALAVGRLNHPNIAMAFDFGESNGVDYLVTEYIPGLNLDEKIGRQPLPIKTVLELGIQLVSGLEAAHRAGVIHRDLKPSNIRLTRDGQLKLLDFGLAKVEGPVDENARTVDLRADESVSGTLPYMSPELLRTEPSDARADIWAAGAVLYEMATGKRAFPDRQPSLIIDAILHYDPIRPTLINPAITPQLEALILKALDRDPDRRYQSAREFRVDLQRLMTGGELATDTVRHSEIRSVVTRSRNWKVILGLAAVLVAGLAIGLFIKRSPHAGGEREQKILAVLPIDTVGHDADTNALGLGLMETLTAKLVQASATDAVQVISPRDLRDQGVKTADEARRDFGTDLVLESSLQRSGNTIRINCYLVDSKTHRQIAARSIETDAGDTFALQDQVVNAVLDMLPATVKASERRALAVRHDTQPAAYEAYIRGRGYLQEYEKPENVDNAIREFDEALKIDPRFAAAYAGLGEAHWTGYKQLSRGEGWLKQATADCDEAVRLGPNLPQAHTCAGNISFGIGNYEQAVTEYKQALDLDPNNDYALGQLADAYQKLGKTQAAEAAYKQAISLRPAYWAVYNWLGVFYTQNARYSEAADMFHKVTELAPDNYRGYSNLGGVYVYEGRYADAIELLQRSIALRPNIDAYINLGTAYFSLRHFADAAAAFQQGTQLDDRNWANWGNLGDALYWAGRRQQAKPAYERALELTSAEQKLNPHDASTQGMIAYYSAMLDRKPEALANLQPALQLAPKDPQVLFGAAQIYNHFGETNQALEWLKKALDAGFSRATIKNYPDFDGLQSDPKFRQLMAGN